MARCVAESQSARSAAILERRGVNAAESGSPCESLSLHGVESFKVVEAMVHGFRGNERSEPQLKSRRIDMGKKGRLSLNIRTSNSR